jgi:RNA polymerase sigma factor for flagellar operon FliA
MEADAEAEAAPGGARGSPLKALRSKARQAYEAESRLARENQLIVDYLPLVRHIVQRVAAHLGRPVDYDDLVSAGTVGLVRAARAYDASKHAEFKTYAYIRIRGAVIDELRDLSFVSPAIHRAVERIHQVHDEFVAAEGREPSDEELAGRCGIGLDRYYATLEQARRQHFLSIHGLADGEPALGNLIPASGDTSPDTQAERKELLERLTRAVQQLPERDRQVILLYYERDLTMKEAAEVLEVTESRISQMHASALFKLSMKMRNVT